MRYIWQHIQTIIDTYNGSIPLTHFLKNYFKLNPKLGSRDRKILSEMAYCWYRCEKGFLKEMPFEEKMRLCLLKCNASAKHIDTFLPDDKDALQHTAFDPDQIFPYPIDVSNGIDKTEWLHSMLQQPRLFIRARKDKEKIKGLLQENNIPFEFITDTSLSLPNGAAIDKILPEESYVVQDASSQATGEYFKPAPKESWWDSCSGAGGKSLLLKDLEPTVKLIVSDARQSIIYNLNSRFKLYKHQQPTSYIVDVSDKKQLANALHRQRFDNIICDVPCSGARHMGTHTRAALLLRSCYNANLAGTATSYCGECICLSESRGRLFYITCSVFEAENEKVVNGILSATGLKMEKQALINGIKKHADSMFITVFQK